MDVEVLGLSQHHEEDGISGKEAYMSSADEERSHLEVDSDLGKVLVILAGEAGIV